MRESVRRGAAGFTMVELMVALVVLMVLVVATSSSLGLFSGRASRADLHKATETLLDQLEFARMRATMLNQATLVEFDVAGDLQTVVVSDYAGGNCLGATTVARRINFSSSVTGPVGWTGDGPGPMYAEVVIHDLAPANMNGICFRPDGRVTQPNGLVFAPPQNNDLLAAGEAQISLRMRSERHAPTVITHNVVVPYNGLAGVRYQIP